MKINKNVYLMRFKSGLRYILLNVIVNHIPSWIIRREIYRLAGVKMEKGCRIGLFTIIDYPKGIHIGKRSVINEKCFLDGRGGIFISDDVSISIYSKIISASHYMNSNSFEYYENSVTIENNVWLGAAAIVLDGSKIDKGSIIGAGCVIKGKTDQNGVYIGNPARKIKQRDIEQSYNLNYKPWMR